MDKITPGRKLILDLLAKSVAKIQAADALNKKEKESAETETNISLKKRKSKCEISKSRKERKSDKDDFHTSYVKKEYTEPEIFEIDSESESALDAELLQIKIQTEFPEHFAKKHKIRKKQHKSSEVEIGAGKEDKVLGIALKSETQVGTVLESQVIVQQIKSENSEQRKYRKSFKKEKNLEWKNEAEQDGPLDTKDEIKKEEYNESKIKIVDLDTDANDDMMSISEKLPEEACIITLLKGSIEKYNLCTFKNESDLLKKEPMGDIIDDTNKQKHGKETNKSAQKVHRFKKYSAGRRIKKFTAEEDQVLMDALQKCGVKVNFSQLGRDLGREPGSIRGRIDKLKTGKLGIEHRTYTVEEDIVILDAVLKHLNKQSLEMLSLTNSDWKDVGAQITRKDPRSRWNIVLKPWILQHYAGTFNLDIRRPLANYVADNFKDVNSIDWFSVGSVPDFAGHTQASLRNIFFSYLTKVTMNNLNIDRQDITLKMIADVANTVYLPGSKVASERSVKRQKEIVIYFESYVKTNCITRFLK